MIRNRTPNGRDCFKMINYLSDRYPSISMNNLPVHRCGVIMIDTSSCKNGYKNAYVLIVRGRTSNIYSFPKGQINKGESISDCASRELEEETGFKITDLNRFPAVVIGRNTYFVLITDRSNWTEFKINDTNEVDYVCWEKLEKLKNMKVNKDIRAVLYELLNKNCIFPRINIRSVLEVVPTKTTILRNIITCNMLENHSKNLIVGVNRVNC